MVHFSRLGKSEKTRAGVLCTIVTRMVIRRLERTQSHCISPRYRCVSLAGITALWLDVMGSREGGPLQALLVENEFPRAPDCASFGAGFHDGLRKNPKAQRRVGHHQDQHRVLTAPRNAGI